MTYRGGHYGRGRGVTSLARGGLRGRGRGRGYGGHSFSSVDRRTTKINASGFEREDKEEVLAHFSVCMSFCVFSGLNLRWNSS